jgi:DNA polymerase-3 subunit delta'
VVTRRTEAVADGPQALRPDALALPWLAPVLEQTLRTHQGHALLVCGSAGAGALEFVLRLSQAWLCEHASGDSAAPDAAGTRLQTVAGRPCGYCGSCRLFLAHTHPDFRLRVPEALAVAQGWPVQVDERRKPSRQIRIEEVRQAIDWMSTTSGRGQGKVLALHPVEAMNAASASALLKTLEESPRGARLVLSTADPALLMPTIRSRCQLLRLAPPPRPVALQWLQSQGVVDANVLLDGAGGMPLTALQWSHEGLTASAWASVPQALARGDASAFGGWPVPRVLDAFQKLCHDAGATQLGGSARFFPAAQLPAGASLERLTLWFKSLQRVMRHAEHPWSEPLLMEALVAEGRSVWEAPAKRRPARGSAANERVSMDLEA